MHVFRRADANIATRLKVYRWGLAMIAFSGMLIPALIDFDASIFSSLSSVATAMLLGSFIFNDGADLGEVSISEGNVRYGNRVYPIDKILKVRVREKRSGNLSLKIWAKEMDSLSIPALPELDQFVILVSEQNPAIEVLRK